MIGCGSFAQLCHGPAQRKYAGSHPDVRLAACCDADGNRAREYAGAFGFARHFTDISAMLAIEKPDAVILAVPPTMTCGVASLVLERGFPLLLEKPPGMSPAELGRLIAAAERGGGRAQVAFNRRYMPVMRRAHEILDAGIPPESVGRVDYEMIRFDRWEPDFSITAIHAVMRRSSWPGVPSSPPNSGCNHSRRKVGRR
jgi:predicted dehydrogenase